MSNRTYLKGIIPEDEYQNVTWLLIAASASQNKNAGLKEPIKKALKLVDGLYKKDWESILNSIEDVKVDSASHLSLGLGVNLYITDHDYGMMWKQGKSKKPARCYAEYPGYTSINPAKVKPFPESGRVAVCIENRSMDKPIHVDVQLYAIITPSGNAHKYSRQTHHFYGGSDDSGVSPTQEGKDPWINIQPGYVYDLNGTRENQFTGYTVQVYAGKDIHETVQKGRFYAKMLKTKVYFVKKEDSHYKYKILLGQYASKTTANRMKSDWRKKALEYPEEKKHLGSAMVKKYATLLK